MKRKHSHIIIFIIMMFLLGSASGRAFAEDAEHAGKNQETGGAAHAKRFFEAVTQYQEGRYDLAAEGFLGIAGKGVENADLYYNLGNAYLKLNNLGKAVLYYEKALRMNPREPDLEFNINYARSLLKDKVETAASPVTRILFFWRYMMTRLSIENTALILSLITFLLLTLRTLTKRFFNRSFTRIPFFIAAAVTVLFTMTAFYQFYEDAYVPKGVIVSETAPVRSGLSDDATELFVLHAGTKVAIEDMKDGYVRIFFSSGKIGWIKKSDIGVI